MNQARVRKLLMVIIFAVSFIVYYSTAARYPMNIADSNELITAAFSNGIAHPPSYPFYIFLLQIILKIPGLSPAFAANISASFFQSLSLVIIFLCSLSLFSNLRIKMSYLELYASSVIGVLTLAFSYFFWDQATYAEVFGLNNVFIGLGLLVVLKSSYKQFQLLMWALMGFAAAHHQTIIFLIPGYLFLIRKLLRIISIVKYLSIFGLFFTIPYAWMWLIVDRSASLSWYVEPTLTGFWQLISRGVYVQSESTINAFTSSFQSSFESVLTFVKTITQHFTVFSIIFSLGGLKYLYLKKKQLFWFFLITLGISGPLLAAYLRFPRIDVSSETLFYHGTYIGFRMFTLFEYVFSLLMPLGMIYFSRWAKKFDKRRLRNIFVLIPMVIPIYLYTHNFASVNKRDADFDEVFYAQVLDSVPENSLVIVDSDAAFGLLYQQTINQVRPDVLIAPTAMHMRWGYLHEYLPQGIFEINGYYQLILSLTEWGLGNNRPVIVMDPSVKFLNQIEQYHYFIIPHGYAFQIAAEPRVIESYDYGLSLQLAALNFGDLDLWSRGDLGYFRGIHLNLARYYSKLNGLAGAQLHLEIAEKLRQNLADY